MLDNNRPWLSGRRNSTLRWLLMFGVRSGFPTVPLPRTHFSGRYYIESRPPTSGDIRMDQPQIPQLGVPSANWGFRKIFCIVYGRARTLAAAGTGAVVFYSGYRVHIQEAFRSNQPISSLPQHCLGPGKRPTGSGTPYEPYFVGSCGRIAITISLKRRLLVSRE